MHFFLDILFNSTYKGDTSVFSVWGTYFDVKGESINMATKKKAAAKKKATKKKK